MERKSHFGNKYSNQDLLEIENYVGMFQHRLITSN